MKRYAWILVTMVTTGLLACEDTPIDPWVVNGVFLQTQAGVYSRGDTIHAMVINRLIDTVYIKALNCEGRISVGFQENPDSGLVPVLPLPSDDCLPPFPSAIPPRSQMGVTYMVRSDSGISPGRYSIYVEYTSTIRDFEAGYVCSNPFYIRE
jgi:hypothetical protein